MLKRNTEKGITLIALVVTIIVLLILAGISIATLTGDNGILTNAQNARIENSHGSIKDGIGLAYSEYQTEIMTLNQQIEIKYKDFIEFLKNKKYINQDDSGNIVTKELLGSSTYLGNGSESSDVYKVEKTEEGYVVNYHDKNGNLREIWNILEEQNKKDDAYLTTTVSTPWGRSVEIRFKEGDLWGEDFLTKRCGVDLNVANSAGIFDELSECIARMGCR